MSTTNIKIKINKEIKEQVELIFSKIGLNMTTAINMFLRTTIREKGNPFELKLDEQNTKTATAIEKKKNCVRLKCKKIF